MATLAQYLEANKENAYKFATMNTCYNEEGCPVVSQNDEWLQETEWDELFQTLKDEKK